MAWADCAQDLLTNNERWQQFSQNSLVKVRRYCFDSAAAGIVNACRLALGVQTDKWTPGSAVGSKRAEKPSDPAASIDTRKRS
jgi:hypothetical protein